MVRRLSHPIERLDTTVQLSRSDEVSPSLLTAPTRSGDTTATRDIEGAQLRRARELLEEWKYEARDRAYADLFEGEEAILTEEELRLIDRIDSDLTRQGGSGSWDADEYGIIAVGAQDANGPQAVCIYHPEILDEGYRGEESLDEGTRQELNDVLWNYCERVASNSQEDLDAFLHGSRHQEE